MPTPWELRGKALEEVFIRQVDKFCADGKTVSWENS
jgi:hypothetical protein